MNNVLKMNTDFSYVLHVVLVVFMHRGSLVVQVEKLAVQRNL